MRTALGVDIGTGGARCVGVAESGDVVAQASSAYPLLTPRPGWTEQDPAEWWRATEEVLGAAVAACATVGCDVVRPALLWNDQRTQAQCEEIERAVGERRLVEITGNPALTGFQAPKVLWLRDEEPASFDRVEHVLLPKDFVRHRLTGALATDASDASGTLFLDLRRRSWSTEILYELEVPAPWFPPDLEGPGESGE